MIKNVEKQGFKLIKRYLSEIGRRGGKKSRRKLDSETARKMTLVRDARRAFKTYHARCFWSYNPDYKIEFKDVQWVGEQLKKNGDRRLWLLGKKLCP